MLIAAVRNLIERFSHHSAGAAVQSLASPLAEALAVATTARPEPRVVWPAPRLALVHQLWGPGFIFPGGEIETLRLARPLGLSAASSLLMMGARSGGPRRS